MSKKQLLIASLITVSCIQAFTFGWPQREIDSDSFLTYFAQLRGGLMSPSLVFTGSEEIKTADEGFVTAVLSEHDEESSLFESTLGNAVIVAHKDNLLTVYANLSADGQEERYNLAHVEQDTLLGECGSSGWQEGNALLEFQVIDLEAKSFVNPRILMPRFGKEHPLEIKDVCLVNRKGEEFNFNSQKRIQSGTYYIYFARQDNAMPYKTTVLVNGAEADSITYDTLVQKNGKLCTNGRKNYSAALVYPDNKKQLASEISIPKGKSKITIVMRDILGNEVSLTYSIEAF